MPQAPIQPSSQPVAPTQNGAGVLATNPPAPQQNPTPTFFGVDPTQISDPQGQTFYKAWTNAQQNPDSPLANKFIQGVKSGQYNSMANSAGIDISKFPQIFQDQGNMLQRFGGDVNTALSNSATDLEGKPSLEGALDVMGNLSDIVGDVVAEPVKSAFSQLPQPAQQAISGGMNSVVKSIANIPVGQGVTLAQALTQAQQDNPELFKDTGNIVKILGAYTAVDSVPEGVAKAAGAASDIGTAVGNGVSSITGTAQDAIGTGGTSSDSVWNMIKPNLSADEANQAARSGSLIKDGALGTIKQVPSESDQAMIEAATPYVKPGDQIGTLQNLQQGVADESNNLRTALQGKTGTWSVSNVKGALNNVDIPLAIKDTAEMTQVKNINGFVSELAEQQSKNPEGLLDLAQSFRQSINSEYGENIWNKGTPISNYIKNVNSALNGFISEHLPDATLEDGSTVADSFKKQTLLYRAMDNIQVPKEGTNAITRFASAVENHPITGTIKAIGKLKP
jgi:hypothetical protein